jgi:hypothetical protein
LAAWTASIANPRASVAARASISVFSAIDFFLLFRSL